MTDRELLELAAKAAKIEINWTSPFVAIGDFAQVPDWNPLTNGGDALRLAVKLGIDLKFPGPIVQAASESMARAVTEDVKADPYAATRRAIVRAAAEIGRRQEND